MKILTYSPSVEAYVCSRDDSGNKVYYDLTDDISSCSVSRKTDGASTFSMKLQNKQRKYNGAFSPMDEVTIYATKTKRVQLFTGYISKVDRFTLYEKDFSMSGSDTIYQLQKTYWDKGLMASQQLVYSNMYSSTAGFDSGYWKVILNLMEQVAGWPEDMISIQSEIPADVLTWAKGLYNAQLGDYAGAESMISDFYDVLKAQ